jgi:hypothetical protein
MAVLATKTAAGAVPLAAGASVNMSADINALSARRYGR